MGIRSTQFCAVGWLRKAFLLEFGNGMFTEVAGQGSDDPEPATDPDSAADSDSATDPGPAAGKVSTAVSERHCVASRCRVSSRDRTILKRLNQAPNDPLNDSF